MKPYTKAIDEEGYMRPNKIFINTFKCTKTVRFNI